MSNQIDLVSTILSLESELRKQNNLKEASFIIVNQTKVVIPYDFAFAWSCINKSSIKIENVSGVSELDTNTSAYQALIFIIKAIINKPELAKQGELTFVSKQDFQDEVQERWPAHLQQHLTIFPFFDNQTLVGGYILASKTSLKDRNTELLKWISGTYEYSWKMLSKKNYLLSRLIDIFCKPSKNKLLLFIILFLLFFVQIPMTIVAPAKVVVREPFIVTAPMTGVIESINVQPDEEVRRGTLLFSMEKRDLKNSYDLAVKQLKVAEAKLQKAIQTGHTDIKNRSEISILRAEVKEGLLKTNYTKYLLEEADVKAKTNGIAIVNDPTSWRGKPVETGEKILEIGDKQKVQIEIFIPVNDSLKEYKNSEFELFINSKPLSSLSGKIEYASFEAEVTAKNVLAYKVVGYLNKNEEIPRIGEQGSARIYSEKVTIFYYLFRKPISWLRQYIGW